jgi:peptidoglycan/LPS O-acetylase OafA/YrhL
MDNLRAFAMLLGVFFHAALAYGPALSQVWPTASQEQSSVMDIWAYFSHTFRMPLFFLIAGFFAALLTEKYGAIGMLKNRLRRITLPFVIFLPLVIIGFVVVFGWAIENVDNKSPILQMMAFMANNPDAPQPPITTTHLWFLYNLTFFYVLTLLALKFLKWGWMAFAFRSPMSFIVVAPLALVPALSSQHAPIPAPEQFMPQLWSFGFFGLFYMLGWGFFKNQSLLDKIEHYRWYFLVVSIVAYAWFYSLIPHGLSMEQAMALEVSPDFSLKQIGLASLQAYMGLYMVLFSLIMGRRMLNKQNSILKFVADSSYWVYIIHLPVLWYIQFALMDMTFSILIQFLISSLGTVIVGLISYVILVRRTPLGWLLNGRKKTS